MTKSNMLTDCAKMSDEVASVDREVVRPFAKITGYDHEGNLIQRTVYFPSIQLDVDGKEVSRMFADVDSWEYGLEHFMSENAVVLKGK